jgi:hypothetical protein
MELKLSPDSLQTSFRPNTGVKSAVGTNVGAQGVVGGISSILSKSLSSISVAQKEVNKLPNKVPIENPKVSLHETTKVGFVSALSGNIGIFRLKLTM